MVCCTMALRFIPILVVLCCKTGSNYEKLAIAHAAVLPQTEIVGILPVTLAIRPLEFAAYTRRVETFRKGFVVPGYLGIDYDIYGRPGREDEQTGMQTINSLTDAHLVLVNELAKLDIKTLPAVDEIPEDAQVLSVKILGSETSLRIHTYGCWPFAGTVMYIINRDIYSVITETRLEYQLRSPRETLKKGNLTILSESRFSFWGSYGGTAILESYDEALDHHLKDMAERLAREIRI